MCRMTAWATVRRATGVALCVLAILPAAAIADCGTDILNDYLDDGAVSGSYPQSCYDSAVQQLPADMELYTDARASILAAKARARPSGQAPSNVNSPTTPATPTDPETTTAETAETAPGTTEEALPPLPATTDAGFVGEALKDIGPKRADEMPLPVIVLGALALLLILAGAGGLVAQRLSRRRATTGETASEHTM